MGYDLHLYVEKKRKDEKWEAHKFDTSDCGLQTLFAILADIKNYHGVKPIGSNKGLPKDISAIVLHELRNGCNCDDAFSYYTLKELEDYDWNQIVHIEKYVSLDSYKEWMSRGKKGSPERYCTGTTAKVISNEEMERLISENVSFEWGTEPYTEAKWSETYAEASYPLYEKMMPELKKLSEECGGTENVRIVFGFNW